MKNKKYRIIKKEIYDHPPYYYAEFKGLLFWKTIEKDIEGFPVYYYSLEAAQEIIRRHKIGKRIMIYYED